MKTKISSSDNCYVGRFAPSPTGFLHAGSLVAAVASYLDAQAHHGRWLVRLEDVDQVRTVPGAAESILQTLAAFGMQIDGEVVWQSDRDALYASALQQLGERVYPCSCSRREIADSIGQRAASGRNAHPYPGTCRQGMPPGKVPRAWRLQVPEIGEPDECIRFEDRHGGQIVQHLARETGDFILRRADGFWAYQLAVVVDDAAQGVTHVVRGMDLLDSTPRQIFLQHQLGLPTPQYLHVPLVLDTNGKKLSKQNSAAPLEQSAISEQLASAAQTLGLNIAPVKTPEMFWREAIPMWTARYLR